MVAIEKWSRVTVINLWENKSRDNNCCDVSRKKMPNWADTSQFRVGSAVDVLYLQFETHVFSEVETTVSLSWENGIFLFLFWILFHVHNIVISRVKWWTRPLFICFPQQDSGGVKTVLRRSRFVWADCSVTWMAFVVSIFTLTTTTTHPPTHTSTHAHTHARTNGTHTHIYTHTHTHTHTRNYGCRLSR